MKLTLMRYGTSLAVVLIAFSLYALVAVPLIEPRIELRTATAADLARENNTAHLMKRHRAKLSHLFPAGSWQLAEPKVLETEHGTLLFQDYRPLEDGRMELKPLTLIVYTGAAETGAERPPRPLIMDAPDGAILQFDSDTDPTRADFGRVTAGLLAGEIKVYSPPTTPSANDALLITTRNVQLDERRIWTPHAVNFRYGASYGSGRDLVVTLLPAEKRGGRRGPAVDGVKTLELVHVDKFHIEMAGGDLLPGAKKETRTRQPADRREPPPAPVEVTCRGPFLFDFIEHVASFEDAVDVIRLNPDGPSDQLNCQLLALHFKNEKQPEGNGAARPGDPSALDLAIDRVVAVGHPVVLRAPSVGATARGQRLEYHFATRRIVLEDRDRVVLVDERFDIEARQLEYELAENGGLGRLWAAGPGRLRARKVEPKPTKTSGPPRMRAPIAPIASRPDPRAPTTLEATWGRELRLYPHEQQQVVSLLGNAGLSVKPMGGFTASEIHLWLNEVPAKSQAGRSPSQLQAGKFDVEPDRMLALGQVKIDAEQLEGRTGRLEVWFQNQPAAPAGDARDASSRSPLDTARRPEEGADLKPPQKFLLDGALVRIQLVRRGEETALNEVSVEGGVSLVDAPLADAARDAAGSPLPQLAIRGQALQLRGGLGDDATVRVVGEPAEVAARGMTMRGSNIQLHRGQNRLWIDGPGNMLLPITSDLGGNRLAAPTNIDVSWQTGMEFDGSTARFGGNVEAQTRHQWARADALDVTLSQRVDFAQAKADTRPEVARIAFEGHFAMTNKSFDESGRQISLDKMQAQNLRIDQQSGNVEAAGPGWVSTVRLGGANPLADRGFATSAARQPNPSTSNTPSFNYLYVEFQLQVVGNIFQRQVEFQRHVRSVYGPVGGWDGTLDADRPERLGDEGVLMNCQRLALREMPASSTPGMTTLEMEATGDTVVEGRGFTARAARISYVDEKQLIVLEGDGRHDADLTRQERIGGPQSNLKARKIMYWRFDNRVEVDDARMLDLQQLGGLEFPERR